LRKDKVMKKIKIVLLSMILGLILCGCGENEAYTELQNNRLLYAKNTSVSYVIPAINEFAQNPSLAGCDYKDMTYNELSLYVQSQYRVTTDGYAFSNAISSFQSGMAETGAIVTLGEPTATVDGNEIIVDIPCTCENRNSDIQIIYKNDLYDMKMLSAAFNARYTLGEKMSKAGLNTVIGMGTVFVMLIVISFIISLFGLFSKPAKKVDKTEEGINRAVEQIEKNETAELESDAELVAVIAAAIAAYEGSADTSGFTVRSVRKIKRQ